MAACEQSCCSRCGCSIPAGESYDLSGQVLCEECYLLAAHRVQTARKAFGISPLEGLTAQQRAIREYIAAKGRAAAGELERELGIPPAELHNDLAVLRHCELVKGQKEGGTVYLVLY